MGVIVTPEPRVQDNDITVLPADDPNKLRLGWIIREEVGIVILNDCVISVDAPLPTEEREEVFYYPIPKYSSLYKDISNRFKLLDL